MGKKIISHIIGICPAGGAGIGAALLLAACALLDTKVPPSQVLIPPALDQKPPAVAPPGSTDLAQWWLSWRDPLLAALVRDALDHNTDVRIAQSRVAEARSLFAVAESELYPTVSGLGDAAYARIRWQERPPLFPSTSNFDVEGAGLGATWEPDIWGRNRANAAAALADSWKVREDLKDAQRTVAADVADNYFEACGVDLQIGVVDRGIASLKQLLIYIEARYEAGEAFSYDVDLVREKLEKQRAKQAPLVSLRDSRRRRLAVLTGRAPEAAPFLRPGPLVVPAPPAGRLPVDVLERRPDVRGRSDEVGANAARLYSAKTDLLPRFGIQFLGGEGHIHIDGLPGLAGAGGLANLSVYLPIFTAGRIQANIAANDARLHASVAEYDKAVLAALEEVENAYSARNALDRRHAALFAALAAARRREAAAISLYEAGRKTFDDVINTRLDALIDEDELVQVDTARAVATVELYRALGGGW